MKATLFILTALLFQNVMASVSGRHLCSKNKEMISRISDLALSASETESTWPKANIAFRGLYDAISPAERDMPVSESSKAQLLQGEQIALFLESLDEDDLTSGYMKDHDRQINLSFTKSSTAKYGLFVSDIQRSSRKASERCITLLQGSSLISDIDGPTQFMEYWANLYLSNTLEEVIDNMSNCSSCHGPDRRYSNISFDLIK